MATKKQEDKLNRLWIYLQKVSDKETLSFYNDRAFLYSVGRLSFERVLIELACLYLGKKFDDPEVKEIIKIIEGE